MFALPATTLIQQMNVQLENSLAVLEGTTGVELTDLLVFDQISDREAAAEADRAARIATIPWLRFF